MADNFSFLILILRMKINLNNFTEFYFLIVLFFFFFIYFFLFLFLFCLPQWFHLSFFLSFLAIPFFLNFPFIRMNSWHHLDCPYIKLYLSTWTVLVNILASTFFMLPAHFLIFEAFQSGFSFVIMSSEIYLFSYFSKLYSCLTSPRDQSQYFDSVCSTVSL